MHEMSGRQRRQGQAAGGPAPSRAWTGRGAALAPRSPSLARLQRASDAAPAVQRLARADVALQRRAASGAGVAQLMTIKGVRVAPTGKAGKELLSKVRLAMFTAGLSPHGSVKTFQELARGDRDYASEEAFVGRFVELARAEVERVDEARRLDPKAKVKGWTRRLKLGRPGWPDAYRRAVTKGQDIRHIVRNATLKNALEAERQYQIDRGGEPDALRAMSGIAASIGLRGPFVHSFEALTETYRAAYLNLGNLFPGAGAINRVIGLTADDITRRGLGLMRSDEFATPEGITDTFENVAYLVSEVSDQMERQADKMDPEQATVFLGNFEEFYDNLTDYLIDREDELLKASAAPQPSVSPFLVDDDEPSADVMVDDDFVGVTDAQIGRELVDIGANFGFDIPDQALESPQMRELIKTEIALANYVPGGPQGLADILRYFMRIKHVMKV